jgi:hypothetical protein
MNPLVFTSTATSTANELRLQLVGHLPYDVFVDTACIRVTTLSAGATGRAALYQYQIPEREFVLIPGSTVTFDASGTGFKETAMDRPLELFADAFYAVGFIASDATAAFCASGATNGSFSGYRLTTTGAFPDRVKRANTTRAANLANFGVIYHSAAVQGAVTA